MISPHLDVDAQGDGIFQLWLAVLISAFFALQDGRDYAQGARDFLFGNNPFFDFVADHMGYEPDGLRDRIKTALLTRST